MYEHRAGDLIVYKIDPDNRLDFWEQVDGVIRDYTKLYNWEVVQTLADNKFKRQTFSDTGDLKGGAMRHMLSLPPGLVPILTRYFPELFARKSNIEKFARMFPGFAIPSKKK